MPFYQKSEVVRVPPRFLREYAANGSSHTDLGGALPFLPALSISCQEPRSNSTPWASGRSVAMVDRAGLPSHVGFPRIRARLAASSGGLLAAEGPADLRARRADVHVGDSAVRSLGRKESFGLAQIAREDRPRRAPVRPRSGWPWPPRVGRTSSRRESARMSPGHDGHVGPGTNDRRLDEEARADRAAVLRRRPRPPGRARPRAPPSSGRWRPGRSSGPTSTPSSQGLPIRRLR